MSPVLGDILVLPSDNYGRFVVQINLLIFVRQLLALLPARVKTCQQLVMLIRG